MLEHELLIDKSILIVTPKGKLEVADFQNLAQQVDPYIEEEGYLAGLLICARAFPGWEDFAALISHLKFVRDHHRAIRKVAAVTDSKVLSVMPSIVRHFVSAEVKHFVYEEKQQALEWLAA